MKHFIFCLFAITVFNSSFAQKPGMAVFAELGGGGLATINFDSRFSGNSGFGARVGIGGASVNNLGLTFVPVGLNYIVGKNNSSYFEMGAGATFVSGGDGGSDRFQSSFGFIDLGYRYAPADGGFFFRGTITPLFSLTNKTFWPFWAGISFGYKF
jgi:hypothetical protein